MTQPQTQTQLPRALRARGDALVQAAQAVAQAQPAPQHTPQATVAPNVHVLPGMQAAQAPAPQPPTEVDIDMSVFAVDDAPAAAQAPAQGFSPAPPTQSPAPASDMSRLEQQIAELRTAMASGATANPAAAQPAAQQAARALLEIQVEDLTPAERDTYKAAIPVVQKLLNQALATHVAPRINEFHQQVTARDTRIEQLQQELDRTRATTFQDRVRAAIPDMDALTRDPRFVAYMDTSVPIMGAGMTVRHALANAVRTQDVNAVNAIVSGFRGAAPAQPTPAPQAAFVAPGGSPSPVAAPAAATAKPTLKLSARLKAGRDFTAGRITKAQLDKIDALYDEAVREGRVAMDK